MGGVEKTTQAVPASGSTPANTMGTVGGFFQGGVNGQANGSEQLGQPVDNARPYPADFTDAGHRARYQNYEHVMTQAQEAPVAIEKAEEPAKSNGPLVGHEAEDPAPTGYAPAAEVAQAPVMGMDPAPAMDPTAWDPTEYHD